MKTWLFPLLLLSCSHAPMSPGGPGLPYDLRSPARLFTLPAILVEISALTDVDSGTVACVQDEQATMYFLSLADGRIVRELSFGGAGDMEGLTRVEDEYFALRSDGLVSRLRFQNDALAVLDTFRLDVPNHNIEGLGYDEPMKRVLVSPKDLIKGSPETRDERVIYGFDPADARHEVTHALHLSVDKLISQARTKKIKVPMRTTDKGRSVPALKLRFSSVAVHPVSGHYYLLSAVDRMLVVVDREGALVSMMEFDAFILPKPEGITFLENNDLLISSEGKGAPPVLARFTYRP